MNIINYLKLLIGQNYEILWSKIWDDTKRDINWIQNLPGISPGRWAVGYNYIYVVTRILNEKKPKSVLDLGLGISSTIFSQYFKENHIEDGIHDVIEQDGDWKKFYEEKNTLSDATKIHVVECIEKVHKGVNYIAYKDISDVVAGKKYEIISVDGPKGSDKYSRRDVIEYIPSILSDSFVIIVDDTYRKGELSTVKDIVEALRNNNIDYCMGRYPGMSQCTVITSANNKFLCTL